MRYDTNVRRRPALHSWRCKQGGTEERRTRVARTRLQLGCARVRRSSVPSILLETFPDF
jgi:hypothetical protein